MKKVLLVVAVLGLGWATQGCKKGEPYPAIESNEQSDLKSVRFENGILVFKDEIHLQESLIELSQMTRENRESWEQSIGFKSLQTLFLEITDYENKLIDEYFKDVDPNLSLADYQTLGLVYEYSERYKQYEDLGVFETILESDGSVGKNYTIDDVDAQFICGLNKSVKVGDELWTYSKKSVLKYDQNGKLIKDDDVEKTSVLVRLGITSPYDGWYYLTSNRRVKSFMTLSSSLNHSSNWPTLSQINSLVSWTSVAEEKKWNNWAIRSGYKPIWGLTASWFWEYKIQFYTDPNNFTPNENNFVVRNRNTDHDYTANTWGSHQTPDSPINWTSMAENSLTRYFKPTGSRTKQYTTLFGVPNYVYVDPVRITNYSFLGRFSGGSSGYNLPMIYN